MVVSILNYCAFYSLNTVRSLASHNREEHRTNVRSLLDFGWVCDRDDLIPIFYEVAHYYHPSQPPLE
ncbi:hypothetical protein HC931_27365 [Candidatus Gracilibacteria bacterium]|nr:hypothetical protein [Candidatus Gracilibacteria bacterium]